MAVLCNEHAILNPVRVSGVVGLTGQPVTAAAWKNIEQDIVKVSMVLYLVIDRLHYVQLGQVMKKYPVLVGDHGPRGLSVTWLLTRGCARASVLTMHVMKVMTSKDSLATASLPNQCLAPAQTCWLWLAFVALSWELALVRALLFTF